jgi:predicted metal-binding membrane protein
MEPRTPLELMLRRDRTIVLAGLIGVAALAWVYILYLGWDMRGMDMGSMPIAMDMTMPQMVSWSATDFILMFVMWAVMMVAMMVPSAAPMILVFATVSRQRRAQHRPFAPVSVFLLGYVVVWSGFAAAATVAQWGLHSMALLSPTMVSTSPFLGGALLVAAGVLQWSPLKYRCLTHCRSPLAFLMSEWREGTKGVFAMGLRHGTFCLGCCWALMTLLLVLGVLLKAIEALIRRQTGEETLAEQTPPSSVGAPPSRAAVTDKHPSVAPERRFPSAASQKNKKYVFGGVGALAVLAILFLVWQRGGLPGVGQKDPAPGISGGWGVVFGSDISVKAAQDEITRASTKGIPTAKLYLRNGYYASIAVVDNRSTAQEFLAIAKTFRPDAYIASMATWCRNPQPRDGFVECQSGQ